MNKTYTIDGEVVMHAQALTKRFHEGPLDVNVCLLYTSDAADE